MTVTPAPLSGAALLQVRRIAHGVRALALLAALVIGSLPIAFWLEPQMLADALYQAQWATAAPDDGTRGAVALSLLPLVAVALAALWQLWRLFALYGQGEVFTLPAVLRLRRLGLTVLALCLVKPLTGALMSVIVTWHNPPGQRMLALGFASDDYVALLFGAVLLAIASVMREAARLAQENAEFV